MPESSLSLSLNDLLMGVARFLGYNADRDKWSTAQAEEVDRYVQSGVRQFYFPPALPGVNTDFEWSFMNPVAELVTVISQEANDLPDSFGRVLGEISFAPTLYLASILMISENKIMTMKGQDSTVGPPRYAAVRGKSGTPTATAGQRSEIIWYPIPDAAYTLKYKYEGYSGKLTAANPYPLGGMKHSETIMESCLAVAEQRANDEKGLHWEQFVSLLTASMAQDRKSGARHFGQMGSPELAGPDPTERVYANGLITYKGVTW